MIGFLAVAPHTARLENGGKAGPVASAGLFEKCSDVHGVDLVGPAPGGLTCGGEESQSRHLYDIIARPHFGEPRRNSLHDVSMARFLLVRHGQSEWNSVGRMQGHADSPLTPQGRKQAQSAARKLTGFDWIASSDLARARDTALIISRELSIPHLAPHPGLREIDVGPWQGLTRRDIDRRYPGFLDNDMRPPGYEPDESVFNRVRSVLIQLAVEFDRRQEQPDTPPAGLVVTHSGVIRVMRRVLGYPDQRNHRNLEGCWFSVSADGTLNVEESINVLRNATISNTL